MGKIIQGYKHKGQWKEKEVEDPSFLYLKDVEYVVGASKMVDFSKWMRGQGCPVMSDQTLGFFKWDVDTFFRHHVKKTILVTGGCGFIGTNLLQYIETYYPNLIIINVDCMTYAATPYKTKNKNYKFYKTNICNFNKLEKIFKQEEPDYVIHLAAESHVDNSITNADPFIDTNIIGTHNLLKLCQRYTTRFHYVNTDEVYGQLGLKDKPFDNSTKWNPRSPYSASKASGAHLTMSYYHTFGLPVTISQCSNNYGPHQHKEKFIPKVILSETVPVYGTGKNIRDWIYVEDHCRALMDILIYGEIGKSYNIGGECEMTNLEVIKAIDNKKNIEFIEDRKGHDFRYAIKTDYKPQTKFKEGIKKTIEWYKERYSL
jgi:dTDP-glucose 4,6-dehydratase